MAQLVRQGSVEIGMTHPGGIKGLKAMNNLKPFWHERRVSDVIL